MKGRKPDLKPNKGWKYRVIICDKDGVVDYDDLGSLRTLRAWFFNKTEELYCQGRR